MMSGALHSHANTAGNVLKATVGANLTSSINHKMKYYITVTGIEITILTIFY